MSSRGDQSLAEAIRSAFKDAEDILKVLRERFEKDAAQMKSANDGQRTVADLQEFARNGLVGLCRSAGIPAAKTDNLLLYRNAKMWLEEVLLQHLLFMLLLMGKGPR